MSRPMTNSRPCLRWEVNVVVKDDKARKLIDRGPEQTRKCRPGGDLRIGGDAMTKITTGLNDAPEEATTAQSGPDLPDDSSQPVEATEGEALRIQSKLEGTDQ